MAITISGDASTTRTNLGLTSVAELNVGTGANNLIQLDSSGNLPAINAAALTGIYGGVKQIVSSASSSAYTFTTTSASEDTVLSTSITPTSSTSKMLVLFSDGIQNQGTNNTFFNRFTRDVSGGAETNITGDLRYEAAGSTFGIFGYQFLDEPGTTTPLEYKRYFWGQGSTMMLSMNGHVRTLIVIELDA